MCKQDKEKNCVSIGYASILDETQDLIITCCKEKKEDFVDIYVSLEHSKDVDRLFEFLRSNLEKKVLLVAIDGVETRAWVKIDGKCYFVNARPFLGEDGAFIEVKECRKCEYEYGYTRYYEVKEETTLEQLLRRMISSYFFDIGFLFEMIRSKKIQTEPRVNLTPEEDEYYSDCIEERCP